jgi:phosphoglycerol transferase
MQDRLIASGEIRRIDWGNRGKTTAGGYTSSELAARLMISSVRERRLSEHRTNKETWMRTLYLYVVATFWCVLTLALSLELWKTDLKTPFYYTSGGDLTAVIWMYKTVAETGWYTQNPRMAAPGTMELYDYPYDAGQPVRAKAMFLAVGDPFLTANLVFLASFLVITWTALYAFCQLGLSAHVAIAASLLFSFSTYHFWRGPHHPAFSFYEAVPLIGLVALRVCAGEPLFFRSTESNSHRLLLQPSRSAAEAIIAALWVSLSGVYYAYFGISMLVAAGLIATLKRLQWKHLLDVAIPASIITGSMTIQFFPFLRHAWLHGLSEQAVWREPSDYYAFGLSLNNLLMPSAWHRWAFLDRWSLSYAQKTSGNMSFFRQNESIGSSPLGLAGSAGFIVLLIVGLTGSSWVRRRLASLANCAQLTVALVLFALIGGISEIIALHISLMIRAYNRISIVLLFLSLVAVGIVFDRVFQNRRPAVRHLTLCLFTVLALLDQIPAGVVPDYTQDKLAFQKDRLFIQEVEGSVPSGSSIMQLPAVWFPEFGALHEMEDYDHLRGFLHSSRLRWSYGAVPGRSTHRWQQEVAALPVPGMVSRLSNAGFSGIYINTLGYKDRGRKLLEQLRSYLGAEPLVGGAKDELRFFRLPPASAEKTPGVGAS